MKPLVIYHSDCLDGFGAAWAIWTRFKDQFEYHAGKYNQPPPDLTNRDVYLVDFSYKRPMIEAMLLMANSITILDHHKSAYDELNDMVNNGKLFGKFDLEKSGAIITWEWFHTTPPPDLLLAIQDRDLWRFQLHYTDEANACLASYDYDFKIWDDLMHQPINTLVVEGRSISRIHYRNVDKIIATAAHLISIEEYVVPACNTNLMYSSDVGNKLAKDQPFAITYYYSESGIQVSFRSINKVAVNTIASLYGGGGHPNAAGCTIPYSSISWDGNIMKVNRYGSS